MNSFDELLNDVLCQDGNQKAPPGMKERILARLPATAEALPRLNAAWAVPAAAILVGVVVVATWTRMRTIRDVTSASLSQGVMLSRRADRLTPAKEHRTDVAVSTRELVTKKRRALASTRAVLSSQQRDIGIAPATIESLVIEPIEIADLAPGRSIMKGKIR
jgi:hypothetical protein